jgi:peptidylprolyl isomerase
MHPIFEHFIIAQGASPLTSTRPDTRLLPILKVPAAQARADRKLARKRKRMKTILTLMTVMLMFVVTACGSETGVETGDEAAGNDVVEDGAAAEVEETDEDSSDMDEEEASEDEAAGEEATDEEVAEVENAGDGMALLGEGATEMEQGLLYVDDLVGEGVAAESGDNVVMHYTGTFENGEKFDSSYDRGEGGTPFPFTLGQGSVIRGWDMGIVGMQPGGKRRLWIPSDLAYGDGGHPSGIPGGTNLMFEVELLEIQ